MQAPVVGEGVRRQNLLGNGAVTVSILDALPAGNFLRHVEAFGVGIFHTHEDVDIAVGHTPQLTLLGLYDRSGGFKNIGIHNGSSFLFYGFISRLRMWSVSSFAIFLCVSRLGCPSAPRPSVGLMGEKRSRDRLLSPVFAR